MQHSTLRRTLQLLNAGDAAGKQRVRAQGAFGGLPLLHKLFGYRLADVIEIFLVAEASGHAAAFHLRTGDFKSEAPQKVDGDGWVADGTQLAMRVIEDSRPRPKFVNVKNETRITSLLREMPRQELHQVYRGILQFRECLC